MLVWYVSCLVWSTRNYKCLKTLDGHDSRVAGIDFLSNKVGLVSCSHDKTWKIWSCDDFYLVFSKKQNFRDYAMFEKKIS